MAKNEVYGAYDHWSMVILYDPKTGGIVHTHQAVKREGVCILTRPRWRSWRRITRRGRKTPQSVG
jgi:hypothetical protein